MMHPLERFAYCPVCGSKHFDVQDFKSKKCQNCGFEYYMNPSAATAAFIVNDQNELLVLTRKKEPAKGTLDLLEDSATLARRLSKASDARWRKRLDSPSTKPTTSSASPTSIATQSSTSPHSTLSSAAMSATSVRYRPKDDAAKAQWISLDDIHTELFGLRSIRQALYEFIDSLKH